jgi:UDP-glucuronate 4-epimerase
MKVLVTGSAGFIGSALSIRLLDRGDTVIGIDNHNDYYDPTLKEGVVSSYRNTPSMQGLSIIFFLQGCQIFS